MQLPKVTSTQNAVSRVAGAAARHASGEKPAARQVSEEIQHAATCGCPQCKGGGRAPAPLTAQAPVAEALAKRANGTKKAVTVGEAPVEQEMTLAQLEQLVAKGKRGVTEVVDVNADISEAADWTPGEGGPMVVARGTAGSGSDLARRMVTGKNR